MPPQHLAVLLDAAPEGQAHQLALQVVVPLVVGAGEALDVAVALAAEGHAAVRAAVLDDAHRAVGVAHHDHAALADLAAPEVAGARDLALQADVAPVAAVEEALELVAVDRVVGVDPAGRAAGRCVAPREAGGGVGGRAGRGRREHVGRCRVVHGPILAPAHASTNAVRRIFELHAVKHRWPSTSTCCVSSTR
jgi:hypothetical protein